MEPEYRKVRVYRFEELSDEAKNNVRWNYAASEYPFAYDALASLEAVLDFFSVKVTDYSINWLVPAYSRVTFRLPYMYEDPINDEEREDFLDDDTVKYLSDDPLQFTGYTADMDVVNGILEAYERGEREPRELIRAGIEAWLDACRKDFEYLLSDEELTERYHNVDFTEEGEMFRW